MLKIQISNPQLLFIKDEKDQNLGQAIETIFPSDTEYAFIVWTNLFIPISYKYDISIMIDDLMDIIEFIDGNEKKFENYWASNTFASNWQLDKKGVNIQIYATWDSVLGGLKELLNERQIISVGSNILRENIVNLLVFIKKALDRCGYGNELKNYTRIEKIVKTILP